MHAKFSPICIYSACNTWRILASMCPVQINHTMSRLWSMRLQDPPVHALSCQLHILTGCRQRGRRRCSCRTCCSSARCRAACKGSAGRVLAASFLPDLRCHRLVQSLHLHPCQICRPRRVWHRMLQRTRSRCLAAGCGEPGRGRSAASSLGFHHSPRHPACQLVRRFIRADTASPRVAVVGQWWVLEPHLWGGQRLHSMLGASSWHLL